MQYKGAGLNCLRIYFHWGFHSPRYDLNESGNYLRDFFFLTKLIISASERVSTTSLAIEMLSIFCAYVRSSVYGSWLHLARTYVLRLQEEECPRECAFVFRLLTVSPSFFFGQVAAAEDRGTHPPHVQPSCQEIRRALHHAQLQLASRDLWHLRAASGDKRQSRMFDWLAAGERAVS